MGSPVFKAYSVQHSATRKRVPVRTNDGCWYLSVTTLAGLALNVLFGLWWADPLAALVIAVFLDREAREAWAGEDNDDRLELEGPEFHGHAGGHREGEESL